MTPSEQLAAAADLIRDLAAKASDGPWVDVQGGWCMRSQPAEDRATWQTVCEGYTLENGRWIAALSPAIAEPLETMFREYARCTDELAYAVDNTPDGQAMLRLASALLGEDVHG